MRRVYTHITCDMPDCNGSWDGDGVEEDYHFVPPGWGTVHLTWKADGDTQRTRAVLACPLCVHRANLMWEATR